MDPCWNVAQKSVHVLSTIYFPWIHTGTMITLTTPNERSERICIASRMIYLLSSLTLQVVLKYLFACLTSYPNSKFYSLIRIFRWLYIYNIQYKNNLCMIFLKDFCTVKTSSFFMHAHAQSQRDKLWMLEFCHPLSTGVPIK